MICNLYPTPGNGKLRADTQPSGEYNSQRKVKGHHACARMVSLHTLTKSNPKTSQEQLLSMYLPPYIPYRRSPSLDDSGRYGMVLLGYNQKQEIKKYHDIKNIKRIGDFCHSSC
jgi:hypothetical protein